MSGKKYIAQQRVKHSITKQYIQIGEEVDMGHATAAQIEALIDRDVLRAIETQEPPAGTVEEVGPARKSSRPSRATKKPSD